MHNRLYIRYMCAFIILRDCIYIKRQYALRDVMKGYFALQFLKMISIVFDAYI